jgi:serine/threonine-protein kinase
MWESILCEVLGGLHHAHELNDFDGTPLHVVHRDVSPHNVFVTYDGQVKVVDFGIAKAAGRVQETADGVMKGKIAYMAPEQAMGELDIDRRADVFSVGVMLWEAVTGTRLWKGKESLDIQHALARGDIVTSPRSVAPTIPEELDRICQKALAPDRVNRYASAVDFHNELEAYLRSCGQLIGAREVGKLVAGLFVDKRNETKRLIEERLTELKANRGSKAPRPLSALSAGPGNGAASVRAPQLDGASTIFGGQTNVLSARVKRLLTAAVAAAFILLFVVVRLATRPRVSTDAVTNATPPVVPAPSAPPAPARIDVVLRASPADARFTIDDGAPVENPYLHKFPLDGSRHVVRAQAPGYKEQVREVTFASDVVLELALEKNAPTTAAQRHRGAATSEPHFGAGEKRPTRTIDKKLPF